MYVISYCQIYGFHPSLNSDKIVIYRSFQQTPEKIYDLSHFKREHQPFFNKNTFGQLKDAAGAVLDVKKKLLLLNFFQSNLNLQLTPSMIGFQI